MCSQPYFHRDFRFRKKTAEATRHPSALQVPRSQWSFENSAGVPVLKRAEESEILRHLPSSVAEKFRRATFVGNLADKNSSAEVCACCNNNSLALVNSQHSRSKSVAVVGFLNVSNFSLTEFKVLQFKLVFHSVGIFAPVNLRTQ